MFRETLLESSPAARKRKRWPMAIAFTAEVIVGGILIVVPLLSTGVIPLSARVPIPPLILQKPVMIEEVHRVTVNRSNSESITAPARRTVILVSNNPNAIHFGPRIATTTDPQDPDLTATPTGGNNNLPTDLIGNGDNTNVRPAEQKHLISVLSEARLINRVEPVYPKIANLSGIQGQVKLHAIIARDGRIDSLSVVSGHPILAQAAVEAVKQWRYRPYYLNGEAVEVETFVTVNFSRTNR